MEDTDTSDTFTQVAAVIFNVATSEVTQLQKEAVRNLVWCWVYSVSPTLTSYTMIEKYEDALKGIRILQNPDKYKLSRYRRSNVFDINGVEIIEGSVINADGYSSDIADNHFHCVTYDNGFFSDIYGDSDPISMYKTIEVVGHAEDYREVYESGRASGNLGEVLK